ncbi:MAG: hypothetical protein ABI840_03840 [bacterium]
MKGLENTTYLIGYIISNIVGVLYLWTAIKKPKLSRLMFVILFGWACWFNFTSARNEPEIYLTYGGMSFKLYSDFINSQFKDQITVIVTMISIGQGLIALGMLLNGWWVRIACIGAIIFLICIAPLGVGSAFPFSITVSLAAIFILKKDDLNYLWKFKVNKNKFSK